MGDPVSGNTECCIEGCARPVKVKSRQLCVAHYHRLQRTGDPEGSVPRSKSHGLTGYDYHGCRCEICKGAKREKARRAGESAAGSTDGRVCPVCRSRLARRASETGAGFRARTYCSPECKILARKPPPHGLLVAKTCVACGAMKGRDSFSVSQGKTRASCKDCLAARQREAVTPERQQRERDRKRQLQTATRSDAWRAHKRWTAEEVEVLMDDGLTGVERAWTLGRSYGSVEQARVKAKQGCLPVCEYAHGIAFRYIEGCRCSECLTAYRTQQAAAARDNYSANQQRTVVGAVKSGQQWTGPELEILATRVAEDDLTLVEVAAMLGRTFGACRMMRWKILHDPKYMKAAGVEAS